MEINIGYAWNELRKAFEAKQDSGDADGMANADKRIRQWIDVLSGIQSGELKIGSRKPTKYPVWVTTEVVHGGFATGKAAAATPPSLTQREQRVALALGAPHTREALFLALTSDEGLAWLRKLFTSRRYKIGLPEDAALLVVAWLCENGRAEDAACILGEISQYADEFRFAPESAAEPLEKTELVHRFSSNDIRERLQTYKCNQKIETQREALQIWIPFMDRLVSHWLELLGDGPLRDELLHDMDDEGGGSARPDELLHDEGGGPARTDELLHDEGGGPARPYDLPRPSEGWKNAASELMKEYERLKEKHTLCRKYHNKKANLKILLDATNDFLTDASNRPALNRARYAVRSYVKAHGGPGEKRLADLRETQAKEAARPAYHLIANNLAERLPVSDAGLSNIEELLSPISLEGCEGAAIPTKLCATVRRAQAASIPELIARGVIPSAETMAGLTPQLTALEIGRAYADEDMGLLIAETYKAFSRRRSLLLTDLSSQVRFDELPWVKPVIDERLNSECYTGAALRLAAYAIDFFPGVVLPNPLVEQLNALYWLAGKQRPFLAELAADIFTGKFTPKFDDAAAAAAGLLRGTLYERYYGLNYAYFEKRINAASNSITAKKSSAGQKTLLELAVKEHMDKTPGLYPNYVVENGMQIERAQIYTTHNLASLIAENIRLEHSYEELAAMAFKHSQRLIVRGVKSMRQRHNYLRAVKNSAYAWRQALFFLSLAPAETVDATIRAAEELFLQALGQDVAGELFARLKSSAHAHSECAESGRADSERAISGRADEKARPFMGWTAGPHWIVEV